MVLGSVGTYARDSNYQGRQCRLRPTLSQVIAVENWVFAIVFETALTLSFSRVAPLSG